MGTDTLSIVFRHQVKIWEISDSNGNLYVADYGSGVIRKFSPTGADLGIFASDGLVHLRNVMVARCQHFSRHSGPEKLDLALIVKTRRVNWITFPA